MQINQYVVVHRETANWSALKGKWRLMDALSNIIRFRSKIETFIDRHPLMDGFLGQKAVYMNLNRTNFLHGMSKISYGGDDFDVAVDLAAMQKFKLMPKTYVTVHNGYDPGFVLTRRQATKCYPHYAEVISLLKQKLPWLTVVQIGTSTSTPIPGVDFNLVEKTNLEEVAEIIRNGQLHIDNEGGLVHLARCLGVKCCVIFGPTSIEYFAYENNINIPPKFCGGCWWINETWMDQCPRGFAQARCMSEQDPQHIANSIMPHLFEVVSLVDGAQHGNAGAAASVIYQANQG
jgi:hypothetical protein